MLLYFIAFNILEASLPSLVSKQTMPASKGSAMGVYSSFQFLGIFAGGLLAGILYQWGLIYIFIGNGILALTWFIMTSFMKPDAVLSIVKIPSTQFEPTLQYLSQGFAAKNPSTAPADDKYIKPLADIVDKLNCNIFQYHFKKFYLGFLSYQLHFQDELPLDIFNLIKQYLFALREADFILDFVDFPLVEERSMIYK